MIDSTELRRTISMTPNRCDRGQQIGIPDKLWSRSQRARRPTGPLCIGIEHSPSALEAGDWNIIEGAFFPEFREKHIIQRSLFASHRTALTHSQPLMPRSMAVCCGAICPANARLMHRRRGTAHLLFVTLQCIITGPSQLTHRK
jgi:hypothetical protein